VDDNIIHKLLSSVHYILHVETWGQRGGDLGVENLGAETWGWRLNSLWSDTLNIWLDTVEVISIYTAAGLMIQVR